MINYTNPDAVREHDFAHLGILDFTSVFGDFADDYDHAAITVDYIEAMNNALPDGVNISPTSIVVAPAGMEVDQVRTALLTARETVDFYAIAERHDRAIAAEAAEVPAPAVAPVDRVRVAVLIADPETDGTDWTIVENVPTHCLGDRDAEAHEIGMFVHGSFRSEVIVCDTVTTVEGESYTAGCSTFSGFDPEDPEDAAAIAAHDGCEHTLFGDDAQRAEVTPAPADPRERFGKWIAETDTADLALFENVEEWTLETSHDQDPRRIIARVSRKTWDPKVIEITVLLEVAKGPADGYDQTRYTLDPDDTEYPYIDSVEAARLEAVEVIHGFMHNYRHDGNPEL